MSWMKGLTRYGWNHPDPKGKGLSSGSQSRVSASTTRQNDNALLGIGTLHTLAGEGVLNNFIIRLQDPSVRCVLVSTNSAGQLDELSDRARRSASWEEFNEEFLRTDQSRKNFDLVRYSARVCRPAGARALQPLLLLLCPRETGRAGGSTRGPGFAGPARRSSNKARQNRCQVAPFRHTRPATLGRA